MASRSESLGVDASYPCPCCGYLVFAQPPGSYDICPICFWEDDIVQLRWVRYPGGANTPSLADAQRTYVRTNATDLLALCHVRPVAASDRRDPEWRCVEGEADVEPYVPGTDYGRTYPEDPTRLYYWRGTYWRR
jgi:hypothetical protein